MLSDDRNELVNGYMCQIIKADRSNCFTSLVMSFSKGNQA